MEQLRPPNTQVMPHIVQVFQPPTVTSSKIPNPQIIHISHPPLQTSQGNVTYQQTFPESLIPVSQHVEVVQNHQLQTSQNQIVMSCQQTHLQNLPIQTQMQSQIIQASEMEPMITSHVILPPQVPMFKQHMIVNNLQPHYYRQFEYQKEQCIVTKLEPEVSLVEKPNECKPDNTTQIDNVVPKKRTRSQIPNPNEWACNIRKLKHQSGEAYISRRGKYVPERRVTNKKDCLRSCRFKCNERINDADREHIFKAFYSLNANEKKHFLLNTTERNYIRHYKISDGACRRKYSFKYFFLVRAVRYKVCKNFYLGTLAISQKPVYNVHLGKSDMNIPKRDGRGLSQASTHSLPSETKDRVREHIKSFKTIDMKPVKQFSKKRQYLESYLSIKQMYNLYVKECNKDNSVPVKESMYRKIFKQEFNLYFKKVKVEQLLCCKCKGPVKKKNDVFNNS